MSPTWRLADRTLELERPMGVGIVNVTSDSIWSGARSETPQQAVEDGLALAEAGFEMLDVGAIAARSGPEVPAEEEAARLVPAVKGLVTATRLPVSVDTFSPRVARAGLAAGAVVVNDISGAADPELLELAAEAGCGLVVMHIEGPPRVDRELPRHDDPVARLGEWFAERIEAARTAGVDPEQIAIDPGLDFDLGVADDLEILRRLGELHAFERPIYISLSRKDFLGAVLAGSWEERLPAAEREWATAAATALAVLEGGTVMRIHDPSSLQAMRIAGAIAHA